MVNQLFNHLLHCYQEILQLKQDERRSFTYIVLALTMIFFSYPMVRSTVTAIFLESYGAKSSPYVWVYSVVALSAIIGIYDRWQKRAGIHRLYILTAMITTTLMIISVIMIKNGYPLFSYFLFVIKEVYIVLLVHFALAFFNASVSEERAKLLYGPLGAIGSIGGILGGLSTSYLTGHLSTHYILIFGSIIISISSYLFYRSQIESLKHEVPKSKNQEPILNQSPLSAIAEIRPYIFWIAVVVSLSQFSVGLAHFKFNLLLEQIVPNMDSKTHYLGLLFSAINIFTLIVQFIITPVAFKVFQNRTIHLAIPSLLIMLTLCGFIIGGGVLLPVAITFITFKGVDYSIFSSAKEILYFQLNKIQRYGAKYIVDMVVYRLAKGVIYLVLIFFQSPQVINLLLFSSLLLWPVAIIMLFNARPQTKQANEHLLPQGGGS
jgi:ATP:ADP antiporter, AAA family